MFYLYIYLFNEYVGNCNKSVIDTWCDGVQKMRSLNSCDCTTAYFPDLSSWYHFFFAGELQIQIKWIVDSRDWHTNSKNILGASVILDVLVSPCTSTDFISFCVIFSRTVKLRYIRWLYFKSVLLIYSLFF